MNNIDLFRSNIKRIDIENYNLCNRRCLTCPQSLNIRNRKLEVLAVEFFVKLLNELSECCYSETLAIGRYHEPLMYFDLTLNRIKIAKKHVPSMRIILNTNGDFLTSERLHLLCENGLSEIKIMKYQMDSFSTKNGEYLCFQMAERLGKKIIRKNIIENEICFMQLENESDMIVSVRSENYYSSRGNYRGALLNNMERSNRTIPCLVPKKSIDIDYNGCVLPCCNLISDSSLHKSYIIGNIMNSKIYDLYGTLLNSEFYNAIFQGKFDNYETCKFCSYVF